MVIDAMMLETTSVTARMGIICSSIQQLLELCITLKKIPKSTYSKIVMILSLLPFIRTFVLLQKLDQNLLFHSGIVIQWKSLGTLAGFY